ncbi:SEC14-like protein 4 [Folsomia candida]|uniref:CRAL-TRIO domain-containing protein n=1 Tax=Folsomia candida TaxID=158441 RepID=A0A226DCY2_FOLCA|nr:SEC14-like protein 4 [Folsomia candida]OXA42567.1 hypothetical protein Fcan01_22669 [Folsomia candida]
MAAPSKEEVHQIMELRERLKDVLTTPDSQSESFLLRWIRARDHNLDRAEDLLRNHLIWREEHDVDNVLDTESHDSVSFFELFPYWVSGTSKDGHVVIEVPLGSWDIRKAFLVDDGEKKFGLYTTQLFEKVMARIRELNEEKASRGEWPSAQVFGVVNWEGYSYSQLLNWKALQNLLTIASKYEAHYPEILFKGLFINCPSIFPLLMGFIKQILAPKTLGKLEIFSGSKNNEWESAVREHVDPEQIGVQYGGLRTDRVINK